MFESHMRKRDRPWKGDADEKTVTGLRRTRVREAQRLFRRRKEDQLRSQQHRIQQLEKAIEQISAAFLDFGGTILQSGQAQNQHSIANALQAATKKILGYTEEMMVTDEEDEAAEMTSHINPGSTPQFDVNYHDQSSDQTFIDAPQLSHFERQLHDDLPLRPGDDFKLLVDRKITANRTAELALLRRHPHQFLPTSSAFFSKEFWAGDYVNYVSTLPGEIIPDHLNFWQRLVRVSLTAGYRNLRGDLGYSADVAKQQYRHSLMLRSVGFILSCTRRILVNLENSQMPVATAEPPRPLATFFNDPELVQFGVDTLAVMPRFGETEDDFIDAEEVQEYLSEKGLYDYNGNKAQMALTVPRSSTTSSATKLVELDVKTLMDHLSASAVCLGWRIGYPKSRLNQAIVTSVVRMVG